MKLVVDELALHMPELPNVDARALARSVAERIERHMPADAAASLGALQLRVTIPGHATEDFVADAVAGAILRGLRR